MHIPRLLAAALLAVGLVSPGTIAGPAAAAPTPESISGVVTDPSGHPVEGVAIWAQSVPAVGYGSVITGADGSYSLVDTLGAGSFRLSFTPPPSSNLLPEYWNDAATESAAQLVTVPAGAAVTGIDVSLDQGGWITGRVTDAAGTPVVGAEVRVSEPTYRRVETADDGTYALLALQPGSYNVLFGGPEGSAFLPEYYDDVAYAHQSTEVTVTAGAATPGIDAELTLGGTIEGTVTGPDDAPMAGVVVSVSGPTSTQRWTGLDGRYRAVVAPGEYDIFVSPSDSAVLGEYFDDVRSRDDATPVIVTAGAAVAADAQLARAASISGVVTAADGSSMAGGRVWASATTGTDFADAAIGAGGAYAIPGLDGDATYTLQFKPPYPSRVVSEYFTDAYRVADATAFYLAPGSALTGVDAQLALGGSVAGRVVGPDGAPAAGVEVSADCDVDVNGAASAADGTYEIVGLHTGACQVQFAGTGTLATEYYDDEVSRASAAAVQVRLGQVTSGVDARMEAEASVRASLTDGAGAAVAGSAVEVLLTEDSALGVTQGLESGLEDQSDTAGLATVGDLRAGLPARVVVGRASADTPYVVQYFRAGGPTTSVFADATVLSLTAGPNEVSMVLRTGAQIAGVVRNLDGTPAVDRQVVAFVDDGSLASRSATTGADGSYTIRGLHPGGYQVAVAPVEWDGPDTFYLSGLKPVAPNVAVVGTATTAGVDITVGARFMDVQPTYPFASFISWLADRGISTGWVNADGSAEFRPTSSVTREAMAAFLYRDIAPVGFTPPGTSAFADVATSYPFYPNIAWLADRGISTGWVMGDGTSQFRPTEAVSREAMAAFLYRAAGSPAFAPPAVSPFTDVPTDYPFYVQVSWLAANGISTGWAMGDGTKQFRPTEAVTREAMAAFLQRADTLLHP